MTNVAVLGAQGKLGRAICAGLAAYDDLNLVAELGSSDPRAAMTDAAVDVAVDVTTPDAVMDNLRFCVDHSIHAVVGTTGFDDRRLTQLRSWLDDAPSLGVVIAPNFSIGAILMMRLAAKAAPHFESTEIVELHHPDKADAPSGTARRTAELIGQARDAADKPPMPDATSTAVDGARGASVSGVPVHALRIRGMVAHQEVVLGGPGETLTIRHDSFDRASFVPGVVAGVRGVADRPGLTIGLESILGI